MKKKLGHGHFHGQCVISDKYKIIFILIPKNASSLIRTYIKNNLDGYEDNYFELSEKQKLYKIFCILREPLKRFISAINTILFDKETDISKMTTNNIEYYLNIDTHLINQIEFIKNIKVDYMFNFDDLINLNLKIVNKSRDYIDVSGFINKNNIDLSIINTLYREDLSLLNNNKSNINILKNLLNIR